MTLYDIVIVTSDTSLVCSSLQIMTSYDALQILNIYVGVYGYEFTGPGGVCHDRIIMLFSNSVCLCILNTPCMLQPHQPQSQP